ncbi:pentatricopeptide repeat-containing protein chloroplastic-like [Dorcoceras hygrometricum]|uniref:Pentatricopeptide repeat-containing protein chloroplastic-like n=1 Tax=Dorcoceras hygrometricum TaxID=472368 RepID=A0A2Z7AAI7_9LAMI|nr:pentatricopeptide repeat-containing protein chloroplastic-like [Dorcoceras hygrometricum]
MQHAIINAMKCMKAIKDRIARPVYQLANHLNQPPYPHGTTHQSASRNVAFNQISPGTANLKSSLTDQDNSVAKQLKHNFKTEENTYPKAYTNSGTLGQDFIESFERTGSSRFLKSTVPVSKLVSISKENQEEFSATNIIQNNGGTRRQPTKENHGEQLLSRVSKNGDKRYRTTGTVDILRLVFTSSTTKPAATTSRNIIPKKKQNYIVATSQNDFTALHQLIPNFLRNNQQLVTLNNPDASVAKQNDVAQDTPALLPTVDPTNSW